MNIAISILVLATLFFAGMAQSKSIDPRIAYAIAGVSAVVAMGLAIARYGKRKSAGE